MAPNNYYELINTHIELLSKEKERLQGLEPSTGFPMVDTLFKGYCLQDKTTAIGVIDNCIIYLKTIVNLEDYSGSAEELDYLHSLTKQEMEEDITENKVSLEKTNALNLLNEAKSAAFEQNFGVSVKNAAPC